MRWYVACILFISGVFMKKPVKSVPRTKQPLAPDTPEKIAGDVDAWVKGLPVGKSEQD